MLILFNNIIEWLYPNTRLKFNYLKLGTGHDIVDELVLLTEEERIRSKVCVICALKKSPERSLFYCGNCKAVRYCSGKHQKKHWKKHKACCIQKDLT